MRKHNTSSIIFKGFEMDIEFNFYKGEKRTWEYPGSDDEFEITNVHIYGNKLKRNKKLRIDTDRFINKYQENIIELLKDIHYEN